MLITILLHFQSVIVLYMKGPGDLSLISCDAFMLLDYPALSYRPDAMALDSWFSPADRWIVDLPGDYPRLALRTTMAAEIVVPAFIVNHEIETARIRSQTYSMNCRNGSAIVTIRKSCRDLQPCKSVTAWRGNCMIL
jgi:hypothetical protein